MTPGEYVASLFTIIYGFAITELLFGTARLIMDRQLVKYYFPHTLVTLTIFLFTLNQFTSLFAIANRTSAWSVFDLMESMISPVVIAFDAYLLVPRSSSEQELELRKHFMNVAPTIYTMSTAAILYLLTKRIIVSPDQVFDSNSLLIVLMIGTAVPGIFAKSDNVQKGVSIVYFILAILFVSTATRTIGAF